MRGGDAPGQQRRRACRGADAEASSGGRALVAAPGQRQVHRRRHAARGATDRPRPRPRRRSATRPSCRRGPRSTVPSGPADCPSTYLRANASLTMATAGAPTVSRSVKSRPASSARAVGREPAGVTPLMNVMRSRSGSSGPSGSSIAVVPAVPLTGVISESAGAGDAGHAGGGVARCARTAPAAPRVRRRPRDALTLDDQDAIASKPDVERAPAMQNVRTNRPAATTSTSESATCTTTQRRCRAPAAVAGDAAPCSLSASFGVDARARAAPARCRRAAPSRPRRRAVKPSTRQSSDRSRNDGVARRRQLRARAAGCPTARTAGRAAAPSAASSRLSVSSWRASRQREAPSARRTLSSCRRAVARASSRFAMLAQAISRTSATTAMMVEQRPLVARRAGRRAAGGRRRASAAVAQIALRAARRGQSSGSVASRICGWTPRSAAWPARRSAPASAAP